MRGSAIRVASLVAAGLGVVALLGVPALALQPDQSAPTRLYSTGDSITRAFDANLPGDNLNNSWVNGYFGFWQWLFGLPNVEAHNQRISANFGSRGRRNWTAAENGARVDDLVAQAAGSAGLGVTYATVMLGGNDVCRDRLADLPTDAEFQADFEAGLDTLLDRLPEGATVYVLAVPDIMRLYDLGQDKMALGIVDCEVLWALTVLGFPCGSMLSPFNSEADRLYVRSRIQGYNAILRDVVQHRSAMYPSLHFAFSDSTFTFPFPESAISNLDCFHPSWRGQRDLARETWDDGPFGAYTRGR